MRHHAGIQLKPVLIKLRVTRIDLSLIDTAAEMQGVDRVSFIMEAACRRAEEVILAGHTFLLESSTFDAFEAALEVNSSKENIGLVDLLQRPNRWG